MDEARHGHHKAYAVGGGHFAATPRVCQRDLTGGRRIIGGAGYRKNR
jgi:hypothetical protein